MTSADSIFLDARELPSGPEREAFLRGVCGADEALRAQVEAMLRAAEKADTYFGARDGLRATSDVDRVAEGPGTVLGRYVLEDRIGEGGMGSVYRARQTEPVVREVALKIIKLGMDTRRVVARFELERQALAMMDHPGIARVLDAGCTETGRPYFVMDLVRGSRITEHCDRRRLSIRRRLALFVDVCHAVQHAHQKGVIHRDLKPSNILVVEAEDPELPASIRVIDFGVAKAVRGAGDSTDRLTSMVGWIGTPAYMSPEQADGGTADVDTRADIYSLGVVLYELLTGRTPFDTEALLREGFESVVRTLKGTEPMPPSVRAAALRGTERSTLAERRGVVSGRLDEQLRGDLDWIVAKCLEKDRSKRYSTANGLARDIQRHLADETVEAGPARLRDRLRKTLRKHRAAVGFGLGAAVLLIAATAVSLSWAIRATSAERGQARLRGEAEARAAEARRSLYFSQMSQAQHLWNMSEFGALRRLLWESRLSPHRGFEWYYWMRMAHLDDVTYSGHADSIAAVAFSPDDRYAATGDGFPAVHLWDTVEGRKVREFGDLSSPVKGLAFGPGGNELFVGGLDGTVRVYDSATAAPRRSFVAHAGDLRAMELSRDGRRLVTGSGDGEVRVWEAGRTDRPVWSGRLRGAVVRVAVAGSGDRFAATWLGGGLKVWSAPGSDPSAIEEDVAEWPSAASVGLSEEGRYMATGDRGGAVTLWDTATRRPVWHGNDDGQEVLSVLFSRDGQRLYTGGASSRIHVRRVDDGREIGVLRGHSAWVNALAVSSDGSRLVSAGAEAAAKVWDVRDEGLRRLDPFDRFGATSDWLQVLEYSPDARRVMTVVNGAWIWDVRDGRRLVDLVGHAHMIFAADFAKVGDRIATAGDDHTLRLWSAADGRELRRLTWPDEIVRCLKFLPDGRRVAIGGDSGVATVIDVERWQPVVRTTGPVSAIASLAVASDGRWMVTAGADGKGRLWDVSTGRLEKEYPVDGVPLVGVDISPDTSRLVFVSGTGKGMISVWDVAGERAVFRRKVGSHGPNLARYSPDGGRILVVTESSTGELIDSETGESVLSLRGESDLHRAGAFAPGGREIALGTMTPGHSHEVRFWRAASDEDCERWLDRDRKLLEGWGSGADPVLGSAR